MPSETLKGHIAMGAAAVIWGLMSPVSKLVMQQGEVSSASLATFRLLGAAILFWLASAFVPGEPIERKHRLPLFYASLFGIIFNQMAFTVGVGFTSPADAAIIITITPVLTMILAAFVLREMVTGKNHRGLRQRHRSHSAGFRQRRACGGPPGRQQPAGGHSLPGFPVQRSRLLCLL